MTTSKMKKEKDRKRQKEKKKEIIGKWDIVCACSDGNETSH